MNYTEDKKKSAMTLEELSAIIGAEPSTSIESLFETIKKASSQEGVRVPTVILESASNFDELRSDDVKPCDASEKEYIVKNFPQSKKGYLVVQKIIEEQ